jgi:archaellum component FlaC
MIEINTKEFENMTISKEYSELKLEIGLLEKDVQNIDKTCNRISESFEKLQELNSNILKMINIHEQKHEHHLMVENEIKSDIKDIHGRISSVNTDMHNRMDTFEQNIGKKLDLLYDQLKQREEGEERRKESTLPEFSKYKWLIIGGMMTLGWLLGNVNLNVLATLIK